MIGLKDTLTLLKSGMSLQEIKEREALDQIPDEHKAEEPAAAPISGDTDEPADAPEPEPDYKKLYEELKTKTEKDLEDLKALQAEKIHENNAPLAEEAKKKELDSLHNMVRSFM